MGINIGIFWKSICFSGLPPNTFSSALSIFSFFPLLFLEALTVERKKRKEIFPWNDHPLINTSVVSRLFALHRAYLTHCKPPLSLSPSFLPSTHSLFSSVRTYSLLPFFRILLCHLHIPLLSHDLYQLLNPNVPFSYSPWPLFYSQHNFSTFCDRPTNVHVCLQAYYTIIQTNYLYQCMSLYSTLLFPQRLPITLCDCIYIENACMSVPSCMSLRVCVSLWQYVFVCAFCRWFGLCECVYPCLFLQMYVFVFVCTNTCVIKSVCVHVCLWVCVCFCLWMCVPLCMSMCVQVFLSMCVCMCVYVSVYVCVCARARLLHVRACVRVCLCVCVF